MFFKRFKQENPLIKQIVSINKDSGEETVEFIYGFHLNLRLLSEIKDYYKTSNIKLFVENGVLKLKTLKTAVKELDKMELITKNRFIDGINVDDEYKSNWYKTFNKVKDNFKFGDSDPPHCCVLENTLAHVITGNVTELYVNHLDKIISDDWINECHISFNVDKNKITIIFELLH